MNIKQLKEYAKDYPAVPITIQFKDDHFDPIAVTQELDNLKTPAFLLTGKPKKSEQGYTFMGLNPIKTLTYRNGVLTTVTRNGHVSHETTAIRPIIEELLEQYKTPRIEGMPPFSGGLVGYFSYDYARFATTAKFPKVNDPLSLNDVDLLLINQVVAYNHTTKMVTLTKIIPSNPDEIDELYSPVLDQLAQLKREILAVSKRKTFEKFKMTPLKLQFSLPEFVEKVDETKKHIVDGDIFQLILSNPQHAKMSGSLFSVAPTLFETSPSPYQFYFRHGDFETLGASPETLITKRKDSLFTYPLAGTRRRGKDKAEDDKFAKELQTSPKELSEHNMLIDLGRNDLGAVSQFGSVKVTAARRLLKFSNVMHLGSVVESKVKPGISTVDIINSLLPAGTLSGAPKVSAMQIIAKLENRKRGVYGGCLGYLGFDGDLDLCIGIRLAYRKGDTLVAHSGAGIVADSIAKQEYQEFNNKARSVVDALKETAGLEDKEEESHALSY